METETERGGDWGEKEEEEVTGHRSQLEVRRHKKGSWGEVRTWRKFGVTERCQILWPQ